MLPGVAGQDEEKVWSLASNQALIEFQLRLKHYKQLQWRLVLPVLQAELRVLQRRRTWALLFHVSHRWQLGRHILASMFWKCVWLHEIFIPLPALWQCAYLFARSFYDTCDRFRGEVEECWKWFLPRSLWRGMEEEWRCKDKRCWSSESRFISYLTGHCIIGATGWTWSMASRAAWTINQ